MNAKTYTREAVILTLRCCDKISKIETLAWNKLISWFLYIGFAKGRPHAGTSGTCSQPLRQGTARQSRGNNAADCGGRDGPNVSALSLHDQGNSLRNWFLFHSCSNNPFLFKTILPCQVTHYTPRAYFLSLKAVD